MRKAILGSLVFALISGLSVPLSASIIFSPTSVVANSLGNFRGGRVIERTIDQSGLLTGFTSGVTDFNSYIGGNPLHEEDSITPSLNAWFGASGVTTGTVDFDLGQQLLIEQLALWNDDNHGASSITVFTSNDVSFGSSTNVGTFFPTDPTNPQNKLPAQVFDLTDSSARYVRIQINSTHSSSNLVGWAEVAFDASATAAVPEPGSFLVWSLFGLAAVAIRRRRTNS